MSNFRCPLCMNTQREFIKKEGTWSIFECKNCSFVYVAPLPDEQFLHQHYQQYLPADSKRIAHWQAMMVSIFNRSLDILDKKTRNSKGLLLDIGCGYGFFMQAAQKRGWQTRGIEPCKHAQEYAASHGLTIDNDNLFNQKYEPNTFDVITIFYVLEHVRYPLQYLVEINRILRPGGILLLRVPHTTPIAKFLKFFHIKNTLYDAPSHISDFSPHTIRLALQKTGFTEIHTFPGGATTPHPIIPKIISCTSGIIADILYTFSNKRLLLPGVSKTTIARKQTSHV